jgi:hypothetical protein
MTDDAGNLSIDFLAGFTIFMVALIYVATLIPGLFIGLQSRTIDYDAVAYRTGVILAEDPGQPSNPSWEAPYTDPSTILRFGLALSKDTPNILSTAKINSFFCSTEFVYPNDYQSRAVFGDYPYQFNISLQIAGDNYTRSVGDILPEGYGYSRRVVKIKETSNATIGLAQIQQYYWSNETNLTYAPETHIFSIYLNCTNLAENGPDYNNPAYQINPIDPLGEGVVINLTDLDQTTCESTASQKFHPPSGCNGGSQPTINLSSISIYQSRPLPEGTGRAWSQIIPSTNHATYEVYIDGGTTPYNSTESTEFPVNVTNNVSLFIFPASLNSWSFGDPNSDLNITMQFELSHGDWFLNSTKNQPDGAFEYNYDPANVSQPYLRDGVMEVAVW